MANLEVLKPILNEFGIESLDDEKKLKDNLLDKFTLKQWAEFIAKVPIKYLTSDSPILMAIQIVKELSDTFGKSYTNLSYKEVLEIKEKEEELQKIISDHTQNSLDSLELENLVYSKAKELIQNEKLIKILNWFKEEDISSSVFNDYKEKVKKFKEQEINYKEEFSEYSLEIDQKFADINNKYEKEIISEKLKKQLKLLFSPELNSKNSLNQMIQMLKDKESKNKIFHIYIEMQVNKALKTVLEKELL